jgi:hypothetical protein
VVGVFGSVGGWRGGLRCVAFRVAFVFEHVFVCIGSCVFACKSVERSRLSADRSPSGDTTNLEFELTRRGRARRRHDQNGGYRGW